MDVYQTLDVYQAAYLQHLGFQINLKANGKGRIVFSAPLTRELEAALAEYSTAYVPAKEFANTIKDLKRKMYTAKDIKGERSREHEPIS